MSAEEPRRTERSREFDSLRSRRSVDNQTSGGSSYVFTGMVVGVSIRYAHVLLVHMGHVTQDLECSAHRAGSPRSS